jgi:CheY-like chemotaxis protein
VRNFGPEVVFLDLNMPDGDGISLLPQLRAIFGDTVYVAALTGYGQQHDRDMTRAAGFQVHLTKPVDIELLEATLKTAAARR